MTDADARPEHWQGLGLYDPNEHAGGTRLELLEYLASLGCTDAEMVAANDRGRLFALGGDRAIRPGRDALYLDDVADQVGLDRAFLRAVWTTLAMRGDPDAGPIVSEEEAETIGLIALARAVTDEESVLQVGRAIARAVASIAEAGSTSIRRDLDTAVATSGDELVTAQAFTLTAAAVPAIGRVVDMALRHAVENMREQFERSESWDVMADGLTRLGVAFVDMSGFTAASFEMTTADLARLVGGFEQAAEAAARAHGGRVVKFIGDAALITAPDAQRVFDAVADLVASWRADDLVPGMRVRAGLSAGEITSREGDVFGVPVNLAARLVALAPPASVVAPASLELHEATSWIRSPVETVQLRGFAAPVEVVTRTPSGSHVSEA